MPVTVVPTRAPVWSSWMILMPPQKLPKTSQGLPSVSTTAFGSMAFQLSPVVVTFEQMVAEPWSVHEPELSDVRVACPMHDVFAPKVEPA